MFERRFASRLRDPVVIDAWAPKQVYQAYWLTILGAPIVEKLNKQVNAFIADPAFRKRLQDMGITPMGGTADDVTSYIVSEQARWGEVVKAAGIRLD